MVKFVHMADIHLGYRQYSSVERQVDFAQAFSDAMNHALENNVDFIIIAGDLFHKRSEMDPITLTQATKVLEKAKKKEIPVIAVEGNHDSTYFKESFSWMDYLAKNDLIINLKPYFDEDIIVDEWDEKTRSGAYIDIGDIRIYGMKYYGSLTENILEAYRKKIKHKGFTIFMAHAGVEGYINMYGCISSSLLHKLRDRVDYVALGHIHKSYVEGNFIFNPGSLENCDVTETEFEKGAFLVGLRKDDSNSDNFSIKYNLNKFSKRRFFQLSYQAKDTNFYEVLENDLKTKDCRDSVLHIQISGDKKIGLSKEKIEKTIKKYNPLIIRLNMDMNEAFQPVSYRNKDQIERNVIEQLLNSYNYEDIVDEVLRLKSIFLTSYDLESVDKFVEMTIDENNHRNKTKEREDGLSGKKIVTVIREETSSVGDEELGEGDEPETREEEEANGDRDKEEWDWRKSFS